MRTPDNTKHCRTTSTSHLTDHRLGCIKCGRAKSMPAMNVQQSMDPIREELGDPIHEELGDPIDEELGDPIHEELGDPIHEELGDPIHKERTISGQSFSGNFVLRLT